MKNLLIGRTKRHYFEDIVFIAIASVLCGGDFWNVEYGEIKTD